jgi:hypothetical protein
MVGAFLLDRRAFIRFDQSWRKMLDQYRVDSLHMKDFVRPHGRYVGIYKELKFALFAEAVRLINSRKDSSLSVSVKNAEFKTAIPIEFYRKTLGPYTAAFIALALLNAKAANEFDSPEQIAYLVDEGSPFAEQLRVGHVLVKAFEKAQGRKIRTGALAFADDVDVSALQGADVIAWASRRRAAGDGLIDDFEPLNEIFKRRFNADGGEVHPHFHYHVQDDLTKRIMEQLAVDGDKLSRDAFNALRSLSEEGGL